MTSKLNKTEQKLINILNTTGIVYIDEDYSAPKSYFITWIPESGYILNRQESYEWAGGCHPTPGTAIADGEENIVSTIPMKALDGLVSKGYLPTDFWNNDVNDNFEAWQSMRQAGGLKGYSLENMRNIWHLCTFVRS